MTFMVTLIALLVERFFDWSHLRHWHWYTAYQDSIAQKSPAQPYVALILTVLPLLIIVGLLQWLLRDMLYGVIGLLFQIALVLYCLGPQNLWADTFASINALVSQNKQVAVDKLKMHFGILEIDASSSLHSPLLNSIFIAANHRVFAPLFWFSLLGPIGIVLYRVIALSAAASYKADILQQASFIKAILDWIPARLMAIFFVLGKHYAKVFAIFRQRVLAGLDGNEVILVECGNTAIAAEEGNVPEDGSVERSALNLLDKTFIIWLVLVVIMVWVI